LINLFIYLIIQLII